MYIPRHGNLLFLAPGCFVLFKVKYHWLFDETRIYCSTSVCVHVVSFEYLNFFLVQMIIEGMPTDLVSTGRFFVPGMLKKFDN